MTENETSPGGESPKYVVARNVSSRNSKVVYETSHCGGEYTCSCPGFHHRQTCGHVKDAKARKLTAPLLLSNASFKR